MKRNVLRKTIVCAAVLALSLVLFHGACRAGEADYYFREGTRLLKQAKPEQAVAALSEAIRLAPDRVEAYTNRGLAYLEQKRYPEAKQDFLSALRLSPENQETNNNLGVIFCNEKDYDQALTFFQKAAPPGNATTSYDAIVYRNLSFVYAKKGMTAQAADAAGKARDLQDAAAGSFEQRPYGESTVDYALTLEFGNRSVKGK